MCCTPPQQDPDITKLDMGKIKGLPQTRILGLDLQKFLRQTAQEELRQQIKLRQNLNQPETTK